MNINYFSVFNKYQFWNTHYLKFNSQFIIFIGITFANDDLVLKSLANSSIIGPNTRQGPHHEPKINNY